jgi:DNA-directed RNA polymerase specialized sigma24 family protein
MKADDDRFFQAVQNAAATRAHRLAARLGFCAQDREDLRQALVADMLERAGRFDPGRGSPNTFTGVVSEHCAAGFMDRWIKDRQRLVFGFGARVGRDLDGPPVMDDDGAGAIPLWADDGDPFSDCDTRRDLETALAYMSGEQADLFELLSAQQHLPAAARVSGMSSATFYRRVADLQMHLRMFGIRTAA